MKSVTEMIEIMQAYDNGAVVELAVNDHVKQWRYCECPRWDWANFDYRVVPKRKVKLYQALCKNEYGKYYITVILYKDEADAKNQLSEYFIRLLPHTEVEVVE